MLPAWQKVWVADHAAELKNALNEASDSLDLPREDASKLFRTWGFRSEREFDSVVLAAAKLHVGVTSGFSIPASQAARRVPPGKPIPVGLKLSSEQQNELSGILQSLGYEVELHHPDSSDQDLAFFDELFHCLGLTMLVDKTEVQPAETAKFRRLTVTAGERGADAEAPESRFTATATPVSFHVSFN